MALWPTLQLEYSFFVCFVHIFFCTSNYYFGGLKQYVGGKTKLKFRSVRFFWSWSGLLTRPKTSISDRPKFGHFIE